MIARLKFRISHFRIPRVIFRHERTEGAGHPHSTCQSCDMQPQSVEHGFSREFAAYSRVYQASQGHGMQISNRVCSHTLGALARMPNMSKLLM